MKYQFKLIAGQHIEADHTQEPAVSVNNVTGVRTERYPSRTYKADDPANNVINTDTDLIAKFGVGKFQLLSGAPAKSREEILARKKDLDEQLAALDAKALQAPSKGKDVKNEPRYTEKDFDNMTVAQLRDYAAANEIDVSDDHNKAAILETIKAHNS